MKLFISYGHDQHQDFVRRIKGDLERGGHPCWIDSEQIHKQPDWRRSLMDALHGCDWTVGFLSRHSMRAGSVTPQEVAIANDLKAGCLTTVLMEPLDGWQVPVAVGHAQWVDMSDYVAQQHDPAWYDAKLREIRERLSPALAERYKTEIDALRDWLDAVPQHGDITRYLDGFVGREWLVDILEDWRLGRADARLFWLTGLPGTGKTAFSAWITAMHRGNVVGLNLCRWDLRERCEAARVVRTLAWLVARRAQDYRAQLLRLMHRVDREALDRMDAPTLFDRLLVQPLTHCFDGGRTSDRLLLVVDGLDEAAANQGQDAPHTILDLLHRHGPLLPPWVGLVVTSRPEQPASTAFDGIPMLRIDADTANNRADLRLYARGWLGATGRPEQEVDGLIDAIDARADGSFIYLRKLREAHENRGLPLDKDAMPFGLNGLYDEWFTRQFPDPKAYRDRVAPLLTLIVVADTPVPDAVLDEAMAETVPGWDEVASASVLQSLGSLFERRGDGWAPFHKSLSDWLTDRDTKARHRVAETAGRNRLASLLWRHFVAAADDPAATLSPFLLRELPVQAARQPGASRAAWVRQTGRWDALAGRCGATIAMFRDRRSWAAMLAWCDLSDLLATDAGEPGWQLRLSVAVERGDVSRLLGRTAEASGAYRSNLKFAQDLANAEPDSPAWQRELFAALSRIGDILQAQGNLTEAAAAYRSGIEKIEKVAAGHVQRLDWQRDLSVSHNKIGDVLQRQGDLNAALNAFRNSMTIGQKLATTDPNNADWQRDLPISHDRIGDVLQRQGDLNAALNAYRNSMTIGQKLATADPNNADWQRDLSVSHDRIGDVLQRQGDLNAALNAYRNSMTIGQKLATADPNNAEWQRDLSFSHTALGNILTELGDREAALAAYRAGLAIDERLAAADPQNAEWQRDLLISLLQIAGWLLKAGDREAACPIAWRVDAQARLLAECFPQDRQCDDYLRWGADLLAQACGPAK
jgi:tetratricopeptide (TPR) repeat protein